MPKICKDTNERNTYVIFKGENDGTITGMGELQKKSVHDNTMLPLVVGITWNNIVFFFVKTNLSYRSDQQETFTTLKKGQGVVVKTGRTYFVKQQDLDVIKVWFYVGDNYFADTPRNMLTHNLYLSIPRRDGAPPPPDE